MPYLVNGSSIKEFMRCRYRWVAKWVVNRVPRDGKRPLDFGKLIHVVFEDHFKLGISMTESVEKHRALLVDKMTPALDEKSTRQLMDVLEDLDTYRAQIEAWHDQYPFGEMIECEEPYDYPHPSDDDLILRMRPDRVSLLYGKMFHVQNRGLASSTNFGLYTNLARRAMHEHMYKVGLQRKYPQYEYGGTIMNLIRKLKHRGVPTKKEPEGKILHPVSELMYQGMVPLSPAITGHVMECVKYWAHEMRRVEQDYRDSGNWPAPNEEANGGWHGNTLDPYFSVLTGDTTLANDDLFEDRKDPYSDPNA